MRALYDLLGLSRLTSIVDVGANPIDGSPSYQRMLDEGMCEVIGFDPQISAQSKLKARQDDNQRYLPLAIGSGSSGLLYECGAEGMSGLLKPDAARLALFPGLSACGEVKTTRMIATSALDALDEVERIDFLRMDAQGSEMAVIGGGARKLIDTVVIQTEVSFVPLYQGQVTFGEIDCELKSMGFIPHCFAEAKLWPIATKTPLPHVSPQQLLEADMVYVRDFGKDMEPDQWKHLAMIAHHVLGSHDLAMRCVESLVGMGALPAPAPSQYRRILEES